MGLGHLPQDPSSYISSTICFQKPEDTSCLWVTALHWGPRSGASQWQQWHRRWRTQEGWQMPCFGHSACASVVPFPGIGKLHDTTCFREVRVNVNSENVKNKFTDVHTTSTLHVAKIIIYVCSL